MFRNILNSDLNPQIYSISLLSQQNKKVLFKKKTVPWITNHHRLANNCCLGDPWELLSHPPRTHAICPNQLNSNEADLLTF